GLLSLLALTEAVGEALADAPLRLDVVTSGGQDATGGDLRRPEQATVAGVVRVAPLERPKWTVRWIDADPDDSGSGSAGVAAPGTAAPGTAAPGTAALVAEISRHEWPDVVALRRGRRWHQVFEPAPLPADAPAAIRSGGRYLVTGGFGRVGSALAEHLAGHQARLILLSRTALPPREQWARLSGEDSATGRAVGLMQRLEQAGAQVWHFAADVTDPAQLSQVRDRVVAELGGLDGIVHAARLPDTGLVAGSRLVEAQAELGPKLAGTLALRAVFGELPMDFVALNSSVAAIAGGLGRTDDSAANAFLDAYARAGIGWRARLVSVTWGAWREDEVPDHDGIAPAAAVAAWHRALAAGLDGQVAIGAYPVAEVIGYERRIAASIATGPTNSTVAVAAAGDLTGTVARIWREVLGASEVGPDDDFFHLGGTSLVAAQLVLRVRQAVGVRLSMRVLFEGPTVASMVARIEALRAGSPVREAEAPIPRLARPGRPA
ncbi:MAG TPA: KR domain-containing protein, partial [Micromonosporaceae bacterium]